MTTEHQLRHSVVEELRRHSSAGEALTGEELYVNLGGEKTIGMSLEAFRVFIETNCSRVVKPVAASEGDENASPRYGLQTATVSRTKSHTKKRSSSQSSSRAGTPDGTLRRFDPKTDGFRAFFNSARRLAIHSKDGTIAWNEIRNAYRKETSRHLNTEELNLICNTTDVTKHDLMHSVLCTVIEPVDTKGLIVRLAQYTPGSHLSTPSPVAERSSASDNDSQDSPQPRQEELSPSAPATDLASKYDEFASPGTSRATRAQADASRIQMKAQIVEELRQRGVTLSADGRVTSRSSGTSAGSCDGPMPVGNGRDSTRTSSLVSTTAEQKDEDYQEDNSLDTSVNDEVFQVGDSSVDDACPPTTISNGLSVVEEEDNSLDTSVNDEVFQVGDSSVDDACPPTTISNGLSVVEEEGDVRTEVTVEENDVDREASFDYECMARRNSMPSFVEKTGDTHAATLLSSTDEDTVSDGNNTLNQDNKEEQQFMSMSLQDESSVSSTMMNAAFITSDSGHMSFLSVSGGGQTPSETSGEMGYTTGNDQGNSSVENLDVSLDISLATNGQEPPTPRRSHEITLCSSRNGTMVEMPQPDISPLSSANDSQIMEEPQEKQKEFTSTATYVVTANADNKDEVVSGKVATLVKLLENQEFVDESADKDASVVDVQETVKESEPEPLAYRMQSEETISVVTIIENSSYATKSKEELETRSEDIPYDEGSQPRSPGKPETVTVEVELNNSKLQESATWEKEFTEDAAAANRKSVDDTNDNQTVESLKVFLNEVEKSEQGTESAEKKDEDVKPADQENEEGIQTLAPQTEMPTVGIMVDKKDAAAESDPKNKKKKKRVRVVAPRRRILNCCTIL